MMSGYAKPFDKTMKARTLQTGACSAQRLTLDGQDAIRLDNGLVQADVLPGLGGKIWNLLHLPSRTQWIWHNPQVPLKTVEPGYNYDDNWAGGWEELFPNDAACSFQGRALPDHGEWWSRAWDSEIIESQRGAAAVRLTLEGSALKTRCEKRIELTKGSSRLQIHYRIDNLESESIYFLFKQHLALAVTPSCRLELPGGEAMPVDLDFSTRLGVGGPFPWPQGTDKNGRAVDLSVMPESREKHQEFVYVEKLPQGWCGVRDAATQRSLRLEFSRETFPFTWLFTTYGGWRGLYTAVLEPCTNMPKDLNEAFRLGRCARLDSGQSLETTVGVTLS